MAENLLCVVNRILATPAPVLCLDTCALLDIIRVPIRFREDKISVNVITAAFNLIAKASTDKPDLWILILDLVEKEWLDNATYVHTDIEKHLNHLHYGLNHFSKVLDIVGTDTAFYQTDLRSLNLEKKLYSLSEKLLKTAIIIENDDNCKIKAMDRVSINVAPAGSKQGKNEAKDCMIIEHYLCLCKELRNQAFSEKCLFVSSNTQDYGHPQRLRSPLDVQFANVNLIFARDLAMANASIFARDLVEANAKR
jgi:hypothetical protein